MTDKAVIDFDRPSMGSACCFSVSFKQEISEKYAILISFHPETALFRCGGVNLRGFLCGVKYYASAQPLDFLTITKNFSFPI